MFFWIFVIIIIPSAWAWYKKEFVDGIEAILTVLSAAVLMFMIPFVAIININAPAQLASKEVIYQSLVYQLENDIYENDNDIGKHELMASITEWNADVASGKIKQRDFWIGPFIPNIYDGLELIELK